MRKKIYIDKNMIYTDNSHQLIHINHIHIQFSTHG